MKFRLLFIVCCLLHLIDGNNPLFDDDDDDEKINERIASLRSAPDVLAPFQCSVYHFDEHQCGCAVINKYFVLTASRCLIIREPNFQINVDTIRIKVGSTVLSKGETYYEAERLILHEQYGEPPFSNDVALVEVKKKMQFNENVTSIKLGTTVVPDGAAVQLLGWHVLAYLHRINRLQYDTLHILDRKACKKAHSGYIRKDHLCTTNFTRTLYEADRGGILVHNEKVVGIVNSRHIFDKNDPIVYSNVSYFAGWIRKYSSMCKNGHVRSCNH